MRIPDEDFRAIGLHVHDFLQTPRLMDVWAIDLDGGGDGRTLQDVLNMADTAQSQDVSAPVRLLFDLRLLLGRIFGWDRDRDNLTLPAQSYVHQVPADLATRSHAEPGSTLGPTRFIYQLDTELLLEAINVTAHAFISLHLMQRDHGYRLLLAVYVIETKWWTRYYLWLIEPFRRWIVYPGLVRAIKRKWTDMIAAAS